MTSNSRMKENIIKNILIVFVAMLFWPILAQALGKIKAEQMNDFLLIISILLVTVCFENFAFTYEKSKLNTIAGRLISYGITFISMTLAALLLETLVVAVKTVYPSFYYIIFGFSIFLYASIALYDFWDADRVENIN